MTAFLTQIFIFILALLFVTLFSVWLCKSDDKGKENAIEKNINKVASFLSSQFVQAMEQYKAGPWYLVVYTEESPYPLWISNNNIRSIHPDAQNRKLIIKQFNGEDMVVENVERYELSAANEMYDHDM